MVIHWRYNGDNGTTITNAVTMVRHKVRVKFSTVVAIGHPHRFHHCHRFHHRHHCCSWLLALFTQLLPLASMAPLAIHCRPREEGVFSSPSCACQRCNKFCGPLPVHVDSPASGQTPSIGRVRIRNRITELEGLDKWANSAPTFVALMVTRKKNQLSHSSSRMVGPNHFPVQSDQNNLEDEGVI